MVSQALSLHALHAPCPARYRIIDHAHEGAGSCTRLGLQGLQLTTTEPIAEGLMLAIEVELPDTAGAPLSVLGRATWSVESRWDQEWITGVHYTHLDATQRRHLYDFMAAQLVRDHEPPLQRDDDIVLGTPPRQHVLVVDDDDVTRRVIGMKLRKLPEAVIHLAATGAEALAAAAQHPIDVAVLDIRLPDTDGLTLLSKLREGAPRLAAILITSHPSGRVASEALRTEVCDFLTKPFKDLDELRRATLRNLELVRLRRERDGLVLRLLQARQPPEARVAAPDSDPP